jgi:hypothetical protein
MGTNSIDPFGKWFSKTFDDAVVASGVGWMMVQWQIDYESSRDCEGCHDYTMFPNQFNDLPKDMPWGQVKKIFDAHVANRIEHNATVHRDTDPVRITLFLLKVECCVNITDDQGNLIDPVEEILNGYLE